MQKSFFAQMKRAGISALLGIILIAVLTLLPAVLVDKEILGIDKGGKAMYFVVLLGSLAAGIISCRGCKEGKGRAALLCAVFMCAALVCVNAIICWDDLLSLKLILNAVMIVAGTMLGCAFCLKGNKRVKGKRRRYYKT